MGRKIGIILICACLAAGGVCLAGLFHEINMHKEADRVYQRARQWRQEAMESAAEDGRKEPGSVLPDLESLREEIPDIVGWIWEPEGTLDYPIVQGSDNEYYLNHLADGTDSPIGAIFLDAQNTADFSDAVSVLYGHHVKSGAMFGSLDSYRDAAYFENHSLFCLASREKRYEIHLVGAYLADGTEETYPTGIKTSKQMDNYLRERTGSWLTGGSWEIKPGDKLIILSTCAYEFENARLALAGLLREID